MKTLALIPARGGSKGIARKNIRLLTGRPLIAWSIQAALASKYIDSVVVSTEDELLDWSPNPYGDRQSCKQVYSLIKSTNFIKLLKKTEDPLEENEL